MKPIINIINQFEEYRSTKLQTIEFLISVYGFFAIIVFIFGVLVRTGVISV